MLFCAWDMELESVIKYRTLKLYLSNMILCLNILLL